MEEAEFNEVLAAARANGEWAWERLYLHFAPDVLQFLRSQRAPHPEDVLGEVFVDVVRSLHTFSGTSTEFRSWLFRLAQNRLIDEHRRKGRRPQETGGEVPEAPLPSAEEAAMVHADEANFYRLISALPQDQRAAVFMRYALDMQPAEIAVALGRKPGAAKMLIQRGVETLRQRLEEHPHIRP